MSGEFRVLIDHPGHDLSTCIYIGSWDIIEGSEVLVELIDPTSRETLEFSLREFFGVDDDPSLPSTEWEIESSCLYTHPS